MKFGVKITACMFLVLLILVAATLGAANPSGSWPSGAWPTSSIHTTAPGTPVPAPYLLRTTTDTNECKGHGGTSLCSIRIMSTVLIWEWIGNDSTIDGFKLYNVAAEQRTLAVEIPWTRQRIAGNLFDVQPGACWVVTAYAGNVESNDSNRFCLPK